MAAHKITGTHGDRRFSVADMANLARTVGVDMEEDLEDLGLLPRRAASKSFDRKDFDRDTVFKAFATLDLVISGPRKTEMGTGYDVHCPWQHEHTGRATTGAAYVPILGRFKCHHGHCIDRTIVELIPRLDEMLREAGFGCLAALDFEAIDPNTVPISPAGMATLAKAAVLKTAHKVLRALSPREWLAPGVLIRGAVTLLFGPPNQGKSLLLTMWTTALALGAQFGMLKPVKPVKVLTFFAEEDDEEQSRRFTVAVNELYASLDELDPQLCRLICPGVGVMFTVDGRNLVPTQAWRDLVREVQRFRPDVVIADPLVELHTSEEADNTLLKAVVAWFRALAQEYRLAVLLSHHSRKGEAEAIAGVLDAARGASAIGGAVRIAFTFVDMSKDEARETGLPEEHRRRYARLDEARNAFSPAVDKASWFEKVSRTLSNGDNVGVLVPWLLPSVAVSPAVTDAITLAIGAGCPVAGGLPWSPQLADEPRSIRRLLEREGIKGRLQEKIALKDLSAAGVLVQKFKHPNNGSWRMGLRTAGGLPVADWQDNTT